MSENITGNQNAVSGADPMLARDENGHRVKPCDFRKSGKLNEQQAEMISSLHRDFAEQVSSSLSAYLRSEIRVSLESLEQILFRDFLSDVADPEHVVPLSLSTFPQPALIQMGLNSACSLIELLLGGKVLRDAEKRVLTEIDHHLLSGLLKHILHDLENAWQIPGLTIAPSEQALKPTTVQTFLPASEPFLSLKFSLNIGETAGHFVVLLPSLFGNSLIRAQSEPGSRVHQFENSAELGIRDRVLECPFHLMAAIPNIKVTVRDLISLTPGSVLKLQVPVKTPCSLMIEGETRFEIAPVRSGLQRAAQLLRAVQPQATKRWK